MQQLFSAFGINIKVLLLQALNFGILLVVLTYFFYKPLMRFMEERQRTLTKGIDDAQRAEEKLSEADTVAAKIISDADSKAISIVHNAKDEGKEVRATMTKEAQLRSESILREANMRSRETADKILRESEKSVARMAMRAAGKIIAEQ
ncbi:MAG TPA: ATP synthase F0 subunit B [Candidatus Kaiserbacteria bacterium]|nr:ATP synthase F0 subunit B [Candidatus Kaiserbacteria bacterium]